jgi:2-polyprenyl-6-methoxyphenol hydroxylase-like FAD-dependent oxidoreductase
METRERVDVVIVGAGPVGLTAACVLQAGGAKILVVDAADAGANTSRAAVIHARTLEVLDSIAVTERLLADGLVVPVFTVRDRTRTLAYLDFANLPTRYPFTLMLPQSRTEEILAHRLAELGSHVDRRCTVTGVRTTRDGASVSLVGPDGQTRDVDARFVIGADGMHSAVRDAAGIGFVGGDYKQSFVLADVRLAWPLPADEVQLFVSPAGLVVVAPLPGGNHRIVATVDDAAETPTTGDIQALLDIRGPGGARVEEVTWTSRFKVQHRLATSYRNGPMFLAGDAAHVHSPAGGQGMNTGIQDAADLGNLLGRVIAGELPETQLDSYQNRRRPVARRVVSLTDRMARMAMLRAPGARLARNLTLNLLLRNPALRHRVTMRIAELE